MLGVGLGGFIDGILLHQILQWHHMLSSVQDPSTVTGLHANTVADGLFHAGSLLATVLGMVLVWRGATRRPVSRSGVTLDGGARWSTRGIAGLGLMGWGGFNVADQVVNHWLLGLHHTREVEDWLVYDLVFAALGVAMLLAGFYLLRDARQREPAVLSPEEARRAMRRVA